LNKFIYFTASAAGAVLLYKCNTLSNNNFESLFSGKVAEALSDKS
jgi:hypothetical protein